MSLAFLPLLAQAAAPALAVVTYPPAFFADQRPANAAEMLARIPGFTLDYGSGVRGFEGAAGNVLINGQRPTSKSEGLGGILVRIPAARVERIDVIRGGAPGIDMQGKPVVANIVLTNDAALRGQVQANTSLVPDGRRVGGIEVQASGGVGPATWEASGLLAKGFSGLLGDGVREDGASDGRPVRRARIATEDDGRLEQLTGAIETPLAGGKLRLNAFAYHGDLKFEETDAFPDGVVENTNQPGVRHDREAGLTFTRPLAARTDLEVVALRRTGDLRITSLFTSPAGRQLFASDRDTREDIVRAVVKRSFTDGFSAEAGAEAADNRLASRTRFIVDGQDVAVPAANVGIEEERAEVFAKASWRISGAWSLDGQLRYERSTIASSGDVVLEKTLSFVKPRLLATWAPRAATQVRLRVQREVGQLNFDAFVAQASLQSATGVTAGNPDLEPERAWVAEAALEQRFWDRGAIVLTASHAQVQDVVDRGPVFIPGGGVFDRPANIGDGTRDALRADLTLPLDRLGIPGGLLRGFVTRRWSQVEDPTTHTDRPISAHRPVEWDAKFSQDLPARNITWGVELYGGYQQVYYRFNAVDAYKLDLFVMTYAEWRPRPDLNLRVELQNLTQRGYRQTTSTYQGLRDADARGPGAYSDRNFHFGRIVHVRLRKTLGG